MRISMLKGFLMTAGAVLAPAAGGAVEWSYDGGTPSTTFPITVNVSGGDKVLRIYGQSGTEAIPHIEITGTVASGSTLCIIVASPSTACAGGIPIVGGSSFAGLSFASGSEALQDASRLRVHVSGNITGDITVGKVTELSSLGSITATASITVTAADSPTVRSAQIIQAFGDILGDIAATHGGIDSIRSVTGSIGDLGNAIKPSITASTSIGTLQAKIINADISAGDAIEFINATVGGLHGSVEAAQIRGTNTIPSPISTVGDSTAMIRVAAIDGLLNFGDLSVPGGGLHGGGNSGIFVSGNFAATIQATGRIDKIHIDGNVCHRYDCLSGGLAFGYNQSIISTDSIGEFYVDGNVGSDNQFEDTFVLSTPVVDSFLVQGNFQGNVLRLGSNSGAVEIDGPFIIRGDYKPVIADAAAQQFGFPANVIWIKATQPGRSVDIYGSTRVLADAGGVFYNGYIVIEEPFSIGTNVRIGGELQSGSGTSNRAILFQQDASFGGQLSVNANGHTSAPPSGSPRWWWANSSVSVFDAVSQTYVDLNPEYAAIPDTFGKGAAGEVPFTVHDEASDSYNLTSNGTTPAVTWSEFNNDAPCDDDVIVEFYGPVKIDPNASTPPLSVVFQDPLPQGGINTELSNLMRFTIVGTTPTGKRQVRIDAQPGAHLPWGTYVVKPWQSPHPRPLLCDDLLTTADVPVADFEYTFVLANDCDDPAFDCEPDTDCGIPFPYTLCDPVDFNNDSLFPDTQDIADFLLVFAGGTCPTDPPNGYGCNDIDFNNDDLFPDTQDIAAFLSVFSGGPCLL
ncbi:MAG: hypothetical protein U0637_05325 [Phycisphaerales bacterium]